MTPDYDDAVAELDELRLDEKFARRLAAHRAKHWHPQDPDYVPDSNED